MTDSSACYLFLLQRDALFAGFLVPICAVEFTDVDIYRVLEFPHRYSTFLTQVNEFVSVTTALRFAASRGRRVFLVQVKAALSTVGNIHRPFPLSSSTLVHHLRRRRRLDPGSWASLLFSFSEEFSSWVNSLGNSSRPWAVPWV